MSKYMSNTTAVEYLEAIRAGLTCFEQKVAIDRAIASLKGQIELKIVDAYPYNLAYALFKGDYCNEADIEEKAYTLTAYGIERGLATLTTREREVLDFRFRQRKTLEKIGRHYGFTREYIRQIEAKALRKLKHPKCLAVMKAYSYQDIIGYVEENNKLHSENTQLHLDLLLLRKSFNAPVKGQVSVRVAREIPVDKVDFSVRVQNCFSQADIKTLGEIADLSEVDLFRIRHLGRKSVNEIIGVLTSYGLQLKQ